MTIRTFDDATKKALLGLLPFAPGAYVDVTLDCHDCVAPEFRPVFRLRDFTAEQYYAMQAAVRASGGTAPQELMLKTMQEGVLGSWDNLPNSNLEEIVFSVDEIAKLPFQWIRALYWKAAALCSPNKLERESFESRQPSTSESSSKTADGAEVPPA